MLSALPVAAQLAPVLFYSDLDSGPATGGEGGADGAFLCVYGENFGQPRGSASLKIGGVEVSTYKVWSDPGSGYLPGHYAKACGQISHATPAGQQNVVLSTGAGVSNAVPFTVRAGNIYFASPAGSDDNPGTNLRPFATLRRCKNALAGGDICYVHSMTITSLDNYGAVLWLGAGGSQGKPLAIVAYPGESVALDGGGSTSTSSGIVNYSPSGYVSYFTLAGLTVNGYSFAFNGKPGSYVRLVDNDIECTGPGCSGAAAGFVADGNGEQSFDHATLLGNRFHDIGCNDPNDAAHYENYLAALHPCAWSNSGAIMAYSSGTTLYLSGTPSGWSAPDVLQITYAGSTDIVRPVKSLDQPYCTEKANYTFDCATRAAPGWQLTLDMF